MEAVPKTSSRATPEPSGILPQRRFGPLSCAYLRQHTKSEPRKLQAQPLGSFLLETQERLVGFFLGKPFITTKKGVSSTKRHRALDEFGGGCQASPRLLGAIPGHGHLSQGQGQALQDGDARQTCCLVFLLFLVHVFFGFLSVGTFRLVLFFSSFSDRGILFWLEGCSVLRSWYPNSSLRRELRS